MCREMEEHSGSVIDQVAQCQVWWLPYLSLSYICDMAREWPPEAGTGHRRAGILRQRMGWREWLRAEREPGMFTWCLPILSEPECFPLWLYLCRLCITLICFQSRNGEGETGFQKPC
jgi:hypothetical protein